jgi:hypothetical protein
MESTVLGRDNRVKVALASEGAILLRTNEQTLVLSADEAQDLMQWLYRQRNLLYQATYTSFGDQAVFANCPYCGHMHLAEQIEQCAVIFMQKS